MNIIEIYNKNHDTVFITRSCKKVKVDSFDTGVYPVKMKLLETGGCFHVTNGGDYINDCDYHELDIVDYEREKHTAFTVGEYITRDGRKAIIHYDISERLPDDTHPLIGEVQGVQQKWEKSGHNYVEALRLIGPWVEHLFTISVNGKEFYPVKNPKDGERLFYVGNGSVKSDITWSVTEKTDNRLANLNLIYRTECEARAFLEEINKPNAEIKINE
ncbi:hypothetical protein ACFGWO_10400 [Pasteurella multocida]